MSTPPLEPTYAVSCAWQADSIPQSYRGIGNEYQFFFSIKFFEYIYINSFIETEETASAQ